MTIREQLHQQKLDENALLISNRQIMAELEHHKGNLIREKELRAEIKNLEAKREVLLSEKIKVEEQAVETVW